MDKAQLEKLVLLNTLGALAALEREDIDFNEAEFLIFSFTTIRILGEKSCKKEISILIEKCMELEDIADLVPGSYADAIKGLRKEALEILRGCDNLNYEAKIWLSYY